MNTEGKEKKTALRKIEILHALESCLNAGIPYQKVTVPDIARRAGISKQTFYRYYANKDDIIRWCEFAALDIGINEIGHTCGWREGIYRTALVRYAHKSLFSNVIPRDLWAEIFEEALAFAKSHIAENIAELTGKALSDEAMFQLELFVVEESYAMRQWSNGGMALSPATFADWMHHSVPALLGDLLEGRF